jgi:hypothetical protein
MTISSTTICSTANVVKHLTGGPAVEVKIGVQDTAREISLESSQEPTEIIKAVEAAITKGGLLSLTDDRGRTILVPATKIAYVEVGAEATRRVGFGSTS